MNFNLAWYSPGTGVVPWDDDKDRAESYFNSDDTLLQSLRELREKLYQSERRMNFSKGRVCLTPTYLHMLNINY
jgi:hypothetical protein